MIDPFRHYFANQIKANTTSRKNPMIESHFPTHARAITHTMSILDTDELKQLGRLCRKLGIGIDEQYRRSR